MTKTKLAMLSLATTILGASLAFAADNLQARSAYSGSTDLPDALAFVEFLRLVDNEGAPDLRLDLEQVAQATGTDLVRDGKRGKDAMARVEKLAAYFHLVRESMEQEKQQLAAQILCERDAKALSADEIFDSMNDVDDLDESVADKYYRVALNKLDRSEREAFSAYLDELKTGISYVKLDSRAAQGGAMQNMSEGDRTAYVRDALLRHCAKLAAAG